MGFDKFGEHLSKLYSEQQAHVQSGNYSILRQVDPGKILDEFLITPEFKLLYSEALMPKTQAHYSSFERLFSDFRAALFENLMFLMNLGSVWSNQVTLSGEKTLDLYTRLYPNNRVIFDPFGLSSIAGISVPDMLVLSKRNRGDDQVRITEIVECSLSKNLDYYERKALVHNYVLSHYPGLFMLPKLCFYSFNSDDHERLGEFSSRYLCVEAGFQPFDLETLSNFSKFIASGLRRQVRLLR